MAFLNTDKRLILPLLLLTAAFIGLALWVWDNNTLAPDEFGKIMVQENRIGEIQTLVADMARQNTEKEKKIRDMAATVKKELAGAAEKASEITAAHETIAQTLMTLYEENRQWLVASAGERAARLRGIRDTMGGIIPVGGMERLNTLADEQPPIEELMGTSDRLDTYIQAYAKAQADLQAALAGLPHKKDAAGPMTRLNDLNRLKQSKKLAEALPDPKAATEKIQEIRNILAAPDIIAAVDALPQPDREGLMVLINERDQQISAVLAGLLETITDGTAKSDLIKSFSPLKSLAALEELKPVLDRLPPEEALLKLAEYFPDTAPVLSASALLAMLPEQEAWKETIRTSISPETLERAVEDISRHLDEEPLSPVAMDQRFTPPVPGTPKIPALLPHISAAGKGLDEVITVLETGTNTEDPVRLAGETAGNLKSMRQTFTEMGKNKRFFLVALMTGFLVLMVICFIYMMTRSPGGASATKSEDEAASCPDFILAFTSQTKRLEQNLSRLPEIMSGIKDQGSENHTRANEIFDAASIVHNNIERVSRFMSQASTNLNTISKAAGGITDGIGDIARNSENAREVTEKAVTEARSTTQKVSELGKAANAIDNVTHAINEISEQTKLLGLNATIEAARAGEAGKGFAVVATEIQALARQTAEATEDIREKVGHINAVSDEMIQQIELISDTIHNGNEMVTSIARAVDMQSASTRQIAENVGEASEGISEVSGKVSANLEFVSGILDNIRGVADRSEALVRSAEQATDFSRKQAAAAAELTGNLKNHEG